MLQAKFKGLFYASGKTLAHAVSIGFLTDKPAMLHTEKSHCPYCGETIEMVIDCSVHAQDYIEDCYVCCQPIVVSVVTESGEFISLSLRSENE